MRGKNRVSSKYRATKKKRSQRRLQSKKAYRRKQRGGETNGEIELSYTLPGSPIKVFTYATERKPTLDKLLKSLKSHGYSYEVLDFGESWKGWKHRLETYREAASRCNPEDLIIFIDAYDFSCIKDAEKVYKSYMERPRKHLPVVYGVEWVCLANCSQDILKWYDRNVKPGMSEEIKQGIKPLEGPMAGLRYKDPVFLNGGFVFGPCGKVQEVFSGILSTEVVDDQLNAAEWISRNLDKDLVDLDFEEKIVRVKLPPRDKLPDENGDGPGPGFLHFPGMKDEEANLMNHIKNYNSASSQ